MNESSEQPALASPSPLLIWAASQPMWIRHIVQDVCAGTTSKDNLRVDNYCALFLREHQVVTDAPLDPAELADPPLIPAEPPEPLVLESIQAVAGINALKPGAAIECARSLTLIYGENGSGKSGFVRILKRAAGARTHSPILDNVRKKTGSVPSATIRYKLGEVSTPVDWKNELALPPLNRISIFDTPASRVHIDDDLAYVYVPDTLSHYRTIRDVVEGVRGKLAAEVDARTVDLSAVVRTLHEGGTARTTVERLSATTGRGTVESLADVTDATLARITELRQQLEALKSSSPSAQIKLIEGQLAIVSKLGERLGTLAGIDWSDYNTLVAVLEKASAEETETRSDAFAEIPAGTSSEWQAFLEAAKSYDAVAIQHGHDPAVTCSYCRQPLSDAAKALLFTYQQVLVASPRLKREMTEQALARISSVLFTPPIRPLIDSVREEIGTAETHPWAVLLPGLDQIAETIDLVRQRKPVSPVSVSVLKGDAQRLAEELQGVLDGLRSDSDTKAQRIDGLQSELYDLEDRIVIRDSLPTLLTAIEKLGWCQKVNAGLNPITTSQRHLTEASTAHSTSLINADFQQRFLAECAELEVGDSVNLEFPGREGRSKRKKAVAGVRPSDVLSEGEQKAVALADFLAEATIGNSNAPIVFDDPVNSMDYRRLECVAERVKRLAATRQVIVFTHNVWFLSELLNLDRFKDLKKNTIYWDIARTGDGAGVPSIGTHPKITSYKVLTRRLTETIGKAKKLAGDEQLELVTKGYGILRSLTEVIAEQGLLRGVAQRHQAHVMMTQLPNLNTDQLADGIGVLYPIYEKACRYTDAHSQSTEQANVQPSLVELETDFQQVTKLQKDFPTVN